MSAYDCLDQDRKRRAYSDLQMSLASNPPNLLEALTELEKAVTNPRGDNVSHALLKARAAIKAERRR